MTHWWQRLKSLGRTPAPIAQTLWDATLAQYPFLMERSQADIDAVVVVLQSDFLTQGPQVPLFEQTVAKHVGAKHALAVNKGNAQLFRLSCID